MSDPYARARLLASIMQNEGPKYGMKGGGGEASVARTPNSGNANIRIMPGRPQVGIDARPPIRDVPGGRTPIGGGGMPQGTRMLGEPVAEGRGAPPPAGGGTRFDRPGAVSSAPIDRTRIIERGMQARGPVSPAAPARPGFGGGPRTGPFYQGPGTYQAGPPIAGQLGAGGMDKAPMRNITPRAMAANAQSAAGVRGGGRAGPMAGYAAVIQSALNPHDLGDGMRAPNEIADDRANLDAMDPSERSAKFPDYQPTPEGVDTGMMHGPSDINTVQKGDTLSAMIEQAYGGGQKLPPDVLRRLIGGIAKGNNIANPDAIDVGQEIDLDAYDESGSGTYKWQPEQGGGIGDSMSAIQGALQDPIFNEEPSPLGRGHAIPRRQSLDMGRLPRM